MIQAERLPQTKSSARSWQRFRVYWAKSWQLYVMCLPALVLLALFSYYPMYGVVIAFQNYSPAYGFTGSPWVGFANFKFVFNLPDFWQITRNTLIIAIAKIVTVQVGALILALLLNEVRRLTFRRTIQTLTYLPYFLSWVVLGGVLLDMLSTTGIANITLQRLGFSPIIFLGSNAWFRPVLIISNMWQQVGWSAIIYLAALLGIDPELYEAAAIDGASHLRRVIHISLPGIAATVVLLAALSLGNVLNAGFEQILNLYNAVVYPTGDILDTWVYRAGLISGQFSLAAAVGLAKSVVSMVLIIIAWILARRYAGYRIF